MSKLEIFPYIVLNKDDFPASENSQANMQPIKSCTDANTQMCMFLCGNNL